MACFVSRRFCDRLFHDVDDDHGNNVKNLNAIIHTNDIYVDDAIHDNNVNHADAD
ncbi:MAG: hypothetical protein MZU97_03990 [Bacillus subtilis]|nr:hypothetical protein [Bacillus subtilis]